MVQAKSIPIWGNPCINIPFSEILYTNIIIYIYDLFDNQDIPKMKDNLEALLRKELMITIWKAILKNSKMNLEIKVKITK